MSTSHQGTDAHEQTHTFPPRTSTTSSKMKEDGPIVVVKIGTSSVMRECTTDASKTVSALAGHGLPGGCGELAVSTIALLVDTLLALRREGYRVVLVTSGAVGVGCRELNVENRPKLRPDATATERKRTLARLQAYAAVGQSVLMQTYDRFMRMAHQAIAQVLLTSTDLGDETAYANARATLLELLEMGVIPIVNENDTVATEEIKYGDNDWLSALVSTVVEADWLFLLTDVDMLYTANPRNDPSAKPIRIVPDINNLDVDFSSRKSGSQWGVGGMNTKITAARLATAAGVRVGLLHGQYPGRVHDFVHGKQADGTVFEPLHKPMRGNRRKWISLCLPPKGDLFISKHAEDTIRLGLALRTGGVDKIEGSFPPNSPIRIRDGQGAEIARGLCKFSHDELATYAGKTASQLSDGEPVSDVVVMAEDLALLVGDEKKVNGIAK